MATPSPKHSSLAQQNALLLALVFALFEVLAVVAVAGLVMVPMARRSADDLANLMILSAQTWNELPPQTRVDFELELAEKYQLALRAEPLSDSTIRPAMAGDEGRSPYLYFLESALNVKTKTDQHLTREIIAGTGWYWRSLPAGETWLAVGFPERRIGAQPFVAFLVSSLIGLVLAILAAIWLARRSVVPLARLEAAAERIGRGEVLDLLPETGPRELAALAQRFNEMAKQVRDLLSARTTLLAGVSHDLRTPLARLRLALALLAEQPTPRLIARMEADIEEMDGLIGNVLHLSRDLEPWATEEINVQELLNELVVGLPAGRVRVTCNAPATRIPAAPSALRRAVGNLLDNALRYGGEAPVEVAATVAPDETTIAILDRGPGIPAEQLQAVFQPFHRVELSRSPVTGGTGLGLAIVRQLADAHGWEVELTSRQGGGLEARLRLPTTPCSKG
jgi:two-component system osmolarity sensor histidine kinase EnvZ